MVIIKITAIINTNYYYYYSTVGWRSKCFSTKLSCNTFYYYYNNIYNTIRRGDEWRWRKAEILYVHTSHVAFRDVDFGIIILRNTCFRRTRLSPEYLADMADKHFLIGVLNFRQTICLPQSVARKPFGDDFFFFFRVVML